MRLTYPGTTYDESDPWGYYLRNCTSYVAWKISQEFSGRNISGWGNAASWATAAQNAGYSLDPVSAPQVGDIAVWGTEVGGGYGHVAYVYAVSNGVATFDEYNVAETGVFTSNYTSANHPGGYVRPDWYIHMGTPADASGSSPSVSLQVGNLVQNGNFNNSGSGWTVANGANFAVYPANSNGTNSFGQWGGYFAATNAPQGGSNIYQDAAVNVSTGNTICATAQVRTDGAVSGGSGVMSVYLLGGGADEGDYWFQNLGNNNAWEQVEACAVATGNRNDARIQFYPSAGGPTIDIADVDMHESMGLNGSFSSSGSSWSTTTSANFTVYGALQNGTNSYGDWYGDFAATNATQSGGSLYQNITLSADLYVNSTVCVTSQVRTDGQATGGSGIMTIYLAGGGTSGTDSGNYYFQNLGNGEAWQRIEACAVATEVVPDAALQASAH
jgi:surface antigen